jgi:hypothetical protein
MNILVELSDAEIAVLEHAFTSSRFKTREELAQAWLSLAAAAWLSWLSGEKRYNSLTEQYIDWIEKIYDHLLPLEEMPSVERLLNFFYMPYGQALYVTRVLNNRDTPRLHAQALEELKKALRDRKAEIDKLGPALARQKYHIDMEKSAAIQLEIIAKNLWRESRKEVDLPRRSGSCSDLVTMGITPRTFKKVCEHLSI